MSESGNDRIALKKLESGNLRSLEKVRAIFGALTRYINSKKLYSVNNPNLEKFAEAFRHACEAYFEAEDELLLEIEQYRITWRGQVVYENEKRDESIAFLLYKDGVGEISVCRPLVFHELEKFVDILKDETRNYSLDVDVVTKLWKEDFESIRYRVFDEYFIGESTDRSSEEEGSAGELVEVDDHENLPSFRDKGRIFAGTYAPDESIGEHLNRIVAEKYGVSDEQQSEQIIQELLVSQFAVSNKELAYFGEAFANERTSDMLVQFFAVILDFARIPGRSASVNDIHSIVDRLIQYFMQEFNVQTLTQVLGVLKKFMSLHTIPEDCLMFFKHIEERFTSPSMLLSLGRTSQRSRSDAIAVFRYYRLVGKKTVPTICALLEDSHSSWLHEEGCRTIISLARDDIHGIINQLDMDKPRIAQDIVYMLKELDAKEIHPIVKELIYYPNVAVKEEVIGFLADIRGDEAVQLLVKLLDDEDKQIRMKTLKAAENIENPLVINRIIELAFDEDIELKNMEEQERIFRAVGKLAGTNVLPQISCMIRERNIFLFGKKKPNKRKKILAIRALEQIKCTESLNLLNKLAHDSDEMVRTLAQQAVAAGKKDEKDRDEK